MSKGLDVPLLNKQRLIETLSRRFEHHRDCKLSDIPSPALLLGAERAAQRLCDAVIKKERIVLVGDYDVDGVTSTALCVLFFREIGAPLEAVIPNRFIDGYGVSPKILERIDADLIFTVDNGITAIEAAQVCKERGIDLIITDHHTPAHALPEAYAIVNPRQEGCPYPFKEICGAQVAWLLMGLLKQKLNLKIDMSQYLELVALAVIADVMPLVGINRTIVQAGLRQMMQSRRSASVIIREFLGKSRITSEDIGFQIAPRLNSAGRMEEARIALNFLTACDEETAYAHFMHLSRLNDERKATEAQTTEEAALHVSGDERIIVVSGEGWHEGVVGIIAARLVQQFHRPAVVLSIEGERAKGSARSLGDVNIFELIKTQEHLLQKFGGHKMAAGLSLHVTQIEAFKEGINAAAADLPAEAFIPIEEIVGAISDDAIDFELLDILERFEPYGEANPRPRFLAKDAEVLSVKLFGSERNHSRVSLRLSPMARHSHDLLAFKEVLSVPQNRRITCSYTVNKNEYNGKVSIQLMIERIYSSS
ncbi:MAG: single-stranded-DNA-specific exonuclease RecJ [Campylobacterales bacterium]|nr:single-stranded-DNA-specific exonuclease RecJ [Campylobacterales bacterium]